MENSIVKDAKIEIDAQLADGQTMQSLIDTTFKGMEPPVVKRAILEGVLRGFTFKDFLEKNVYAIPFKNYKTGEKSYSLVTSIDYARKIGMKSGVCGKSAPQFEFDEKKLVSCTITVKRKVGEHIGEYSETVYFDEYNTSKNLWTTKPKTMLAKVAEMHALRSACPEEMSPMYSEEEFRSEEKLEIEEQETDVFDWEERLNATKDIEDLKKVWADTPVEAKQALGKLKDKLKNKHENIKVSKQGRVDVSKKGQDNGNKAKGRNSKKGE